MSSRPVGTARRRVTTTVATEATAAVVHSERDGERDTADPWACTWNDLQRATRVRRDRRR
jgi:hypothetical protein